MTELRSPLQAQVVQWLVAQGDAVRAGDVVVILEVMKMEHEVRSPGSGRVRECLFAAGQTVQEREVLGVIEAGEVAGSACWIGMHSRRTLPGRKRWPGAMRSACAPHARTSRTFATQARPARTGAWASKARSGSGAARNSSPAGKGRSAMRCSTSFLRGLASARVSAVSDIPRIDTW